MGSEALELSDDIYVEIFINNDLYIMTGINVTLRMFRDRLYLLDVRTMESLFNAQKSKTVLLCRRESPSQSNEGRKSLCTSYKCVLGY